MKKRKTDNLDDDMRIDIVGVGLSVFDMSTTIILAIFIFIVIFSMMMIPPSFIWVCQVMSAGEIFKATDSFSMYSNSLKIPVITSLSISIILSLMSNIKVK